MYTVVRIRHFPVELLPSALGSSYREAPYHPGATTRLDIIVPQGERYLHNCPVRYAQGFTLLSGQEAYRNLIRRCGRRREMPFRDLPTPSQETPNEEADERFAPQFRLADWSSWAYTLSRVQGPREELSADAGTERMEVDMSPSELQQPRTDTERPIFTSSLTGRGTSSLYAGASISEFIQSEVREGQRGAVRGSSVSSTAPRPRRSS